MKTFHLIRSLIGVGLLFAVACSLAQQPIKSPSELNADPAAFQHRVVTVRGYVTLEPEGHNLYESEALKAEFDKDWDLGAKGFNPRNYAKYCLTIANPGLMYRNRDTLRGKTLVVTGEFLADYITPHTIDLGACPLPTAILIDLDDLKRRYPDLLRKP